MGISYTENVDRFAAILYGIAGLVLFVISINSFRYMDPTCVSKYLKGSMTVISVLSAILTTISATYGFCVYNRVCYDEGNNQEKSEIYFTISATLSGALCIVLGLVTSVSASVCFGEQNGATEDQKENGRKLKFSIWLMFGISLVSFLASLFGLYYVINVIPGQLTRKAPPVITSHEIEKSRVMREKGQLEKRTKEESEKLALTQDKITLERTKMQHEFALQERRKQLEQMSRDITTLKERQRNTNTLNRNQIHGEIVNLEKEAHALQEEIRKGDAELVQLKQLSHAQERIGNLTEQKQSMFRNSNVSTGDTRFYSNLDQIPSTFTRMMTPSPVHKRSRFNE